MTRLRLGRADLNSHELTNLTQQKKKKTDLTACQDASNYEHWALNTLPMQMVRLSVEERVWERSRFPVQHYTLLKKKNGASVIFSRISLNEVITKTMLRLLTKQQKNTHLLYKEMC